MNHTAELDGSDVQERNTSTQTQRISAFINQLGNAVLILDSLDSSSLDLLKQDKGCNGLVERLVSIFPTLALSNHASQIDQVITTGSKGTPANFARLSLPDHDSREVESRTKGASTSANIFSSLALALPSVFPAIPGDNATIAGPLSTTPHKVPPAASVNLRTVPAQKSTSDSDISDDPNTVAIIHFLRGGPRYPDSIIFGTIANKLLPTAEGCKYSVRQSDQGSVPNGYLSLTSSPATTSFSSMIKDLEPRMSHLWTPGAIVHTRRGGTVEYGITIFDLQTKALFVEDLAFIRDQINKDYLDVQPDWLRRVAIGVSTTLASGVYLLSGDEGLLERLFLKGEMILTLVVSTVNSQGKPRTNHYRSVIRPFCLRDRDLQLSLVVY